MMVNIRSHSLLYVPPGTQFLYKEKFGNEYLYSCQLCDLIRLAKEEVYLHIVGHEDHNIEYMVRNHQFTRGLELHFKGMWCKYVF